MHRRLITTYAILPRGGSVTPPPPPPPPSHEPAPPQVDEEDTDDEEFFTDLPTNMEAEEAATEQRDILASFETRRRRDSAAVHGCREAGDSGKAGRRTCNRPRRRPPPQHRGGEQRLAQADRAGRLMTVAA
jgi:hypothetical protein